MFRLIAVLLCCSLSSSLYAVQRYQSSIDSSEWNVSTSPIFCEMEHPIDSYGKGRFTFASGGELAFQLQVQQAAMPINNVANLYSVSPFWRAPEQRELAQIAISKGRIPIYIGGNLAKRMLHELEAGRHPTLHYKDLTSYEDDVVVALSSANFHQKFSMFQQCVNDALPYGIDQLQDTVVNFAKNKHKLDKAQLEKLKDIVLFASLDKNMQINLHGHTDSRGRRLYNKKLSQRRSKAVEKYFLAKGVSADQITRHSYGEEKPVDSNRTKMGRANNRRVNVLIDLE